MSTTTADADVDYGANDLTVLEGLEAVRKRPGMYIGSTDSRGLQHCMWEIIDNSVDEAIAGHCTRIEVILHDDDSVEVRDNGRGIPVDVEKRTGLSGLELVLTKLHAGGKFGGSGYAVSGGLHGVGASVVNALSWRLDAAVDRDGATHTMSFHRGEPGTFDAKGTFKATGTGPVKAGKAKGTGTRVRYWADRQIFLDSAVIDLELTYARARQTAFLVPGLEIVVSDNRTAETTTETFRYDGGVVDFVEYLAKDRPICDTIHIVGEGTFTESVPVLDGDRQVIRDVERVLGVDIALRWGVDYETEMKAFTNIIANPKGGTHVAGFERALNKAVNEALRATKLLKASEDSVVKEDVQEGLTVVVTVRLAEPQFEGQTKEILGTAAASTIVAQIVGDQMKEWLGAKANKTQARKVLDKVVQAAKTRKAARLQKETIRRKNALESSSMPAKLADCRSDDMERCELFLIEGDSAGGTLKAARDSEFQALLPLRGKILNVARATEKQMLDNAECAAIIMTMGAGSGKSFDLDAIRYGKLIITCDADVDGAHIRCLLLTLCYRYMRPLLEAGRVYSAVPPLHRLEISGTREHIYTYTEEEMWAKTRELEAAGKKIREVQRYKGLGEMDADQLAETTIDIDHRVLRRMTAVDGEEASAAFQMLMGNDVSARKEFIIENSSLGGVNIDV